MIFLKKKLIQKRHGFRKFVIYIFNYYTKIIINKQMIVIYLKNQDVGKSITFY